MRLIECEKCYRGFLPDDDEVLPIISGRSVAKREDAKGIVCPYCGHKQSKENLVTPLQEVVMEYDFLDDIGEGAFYLDEENENNNLDEEHPTDALIRELEEVN